MSIQAQASVIERLAKQYNCKIWITRDGSLIPMTLMSDRHLRAAWLSSGRALARATEAQEAEYESALAALVYSGSRDSYAAMLMGDWAEDVLTGGSLRPATEAQQALQNVVRARDALRDEAARRGKPHLTAD